MIFLDPKIAALQEIRRCRENGDGRLDFSGEEGLECIPEEAAGLTRIKTLNFDAERNKDGFPYHGHSLAELPDFTGNWTELEEISMQYTHVRHLPLSLAKLSKLKTLRLSRVRTAYTLDSATENLGALLPHWTALEEISLEAPDVPALLACLDHIPRLRAVHLHGFHTRNTGFDVWFQKKNAKLLKETLARLSALGTLRELELSGVFNTAPIELKDFAQLTTLRIGSVSNINKTLCSLCSLEELSLEGNFSKLPASIANLRSLKSLNIEAEALKTLPESLGALTNLKKLSLSNTALSGLLPEFIGNLSSLEEIEIRKSLFRFDGTEPAITALPQSLGTLRSLKKLDIRGVNLSCLPESIGDAAALEEIHLGTEHIKALPESLGRLVHLKTLYLDTSALESLPESIGNCGQLEELTLADCFNIRELPSSIEKLTSLKRLGLIGTAIKELPESLKTLTALEAFSLYSLWIKDIPEFITNPARFTGLRIKCPRMRRLPEWIGKLTHLQKLRMCAATRLPESIGNCKKLNELEIGSSGNDDDGAHFAYEGDLPDTSGDEPCDETYTLPESIGGLTALEKLTLGDMVIKTLPESFGNLRALKNLSLSAFDGEALPESFGGLTSLETLKLYARYYGEEMKVDSKVKRLPESFGNLKSLLSFESNCVFEKLPRSFGSLAALRYLDIMETELPGTLAGLVSLEALNLFGQDPPLLKTLPPSLFALPKLRGICLRNVMVETLPDTIGDLASLEDLELYRAPVKELPPGIANCRALRKLDIQDSGIAVLPECIGGLPGLQELTIGGEHIKTLLESIAGFERLPYIQTVNYRSDWLPEKLKRRKDFYTSGLSVAAMNGAKPRIGRRLFEASDTGVCISDEGFDRRGFFANIVSRIKDSVFGK